MARRRGGTCSLVGTKGQSSVGKKVKERTVWSEGKGEEKNSECEGKRREGYRGLEKKGVLAKNHPHQAAFNM